jgi:hypothetical protein
MINININKDEVRKLYLEKMEEHLTKIDKEKTFWDSRELVRQNKFELEHHPRTVTILDFLDTEWEESGCSLLKKQRNSYLNGLRSSLDHKLKPRLILLALISSHISITFQGLLKEEPEMSKIMETNLFKTCTFKEPTPPCANNSWVIWFTIPGRENKQMFTFLPHFRCF